MAKIYGVGTGPGGKEYLTLKAVQVIKEVDYVFAPQNRGKNMALDTVKDFLDKEKLVLLDFPMGEITQADYVQKAREIEKYLGPDKTGAFVTIGDPLFYSTVINTFQELSPEVEVEYVSGIPAFVAAAARAKRPLTYTGESLLVLDSLKPDWGSYLEKVMPESLCLMKTLRLHEKDLATLTKLGYTYQYVEKASLPEELILDQSDEEAILERKAYISLILARKEQA